MFIASEFVRITGYDEIIPPAHITTVYDEIIPPPLTSQLFSSWFVTIVILYAY